MARGALAQAPRRRCRRRAGQTRRLGVAAGAADDGRGVPAAAAEGLTLAEIDLTSTGFKGVTYVTGYDATNAERRPP